MNFGRATTKWKHGYNEEETEQDEVGWDINRREWPGWTEPLPKGTAQETHPEHLMMKKGVNTVEGGN